MDSLATADAIANAVPRLVDGVERYRTADGDLRLRGPRLRRGPVRKVFAKLWRLTEQVEVELDDIGAWTVDRMDGRTLEQLSEALAVHLKLTTREAEAAMTGFLRLLLRRKLIRLDIEEGTAA